MIKRYITTPIYYVNDKPHLGHAYTSIAADTLARYFRQKGEDVFLLTGTDEHGAKIAEAAQKAGQSPKEFVDEQSTKFEGLSKVLNLSNDAFIRTTNSEHEKIVQEFLQKIYDGGFIYRKAYEGLYCVACEQFYTEKELVDGFCPIHKTKPEIHKEENWFFKLSEFQQKIIRLIESDNFLVRPKERKNEILGKLSQGLDDISISRAKVDWGIKVPWDNSQTIYVWFDALLNYFSAPKISKKKVWPPDLHLVGRDIMWFHAVIWPAMLLVAEVELPKGIFVHGYFTVDGEKMSKTRGNVIDPVELVEKYGADAVRFYVLRDFPFGENGDVSVARLEERYNSDLAAGLGNVVQRVLSMIKRYKIDKNQKSVSNPPSHKATEDFRSRQRRTRSEIQNDSSVIAIRQSSTLRSLRLEEQAEWQSQIKFIEQLTENLKFQEALSEIWKLIADLNKEIAKVEPWKLAKDGKKDELETFLQKCFEEILVITDLIEPYLPETAQKIHSQADSLDVEPIFKKI